MPTAIGSQREYYNERWRDFQHANHYDRVRMAQIFRYLTQCHLPPDPKICDLGCGAGWTTAILGMFGEATGVELSAVDAAQARYPYCRFVSANILEWDHPRAEFDLVASIEVLEHLESARQADYLRIAGDLLKPGGYLILTTPNQATMEAIPGGGRTWSNQPVENWVSAAQLKALLGQAGFHTIATTSLILGFGRQGTYRLVNSTKVNRLMSRLHVSGLWERAAARAHYGLHLAVLAEKPARG